MSAKRRRLTTQEYVEGVIAGKRMILARAITLVESNHPAHRAQAQEVLRALLTHTGKAHRIGISGVPGVGKSTFIERFGLDLLQAGHKVAVLAIDPTSAVKGGSILGDKTRMTQLSQEPHAFIRPSPTQGNLGGVHRKTRETMLLCEAAGFDIILVETVGVGQSEITVSQMVDTYLVLMLAGAGDELQGIKKGILEVADVIAINKADGDNEQAAKRARMEYLRAIKLVRHAQRSEWQTPVLTCSGLRGKGLDQVWEILQAHRAALSEAGLFEQRRRKQRLLWMWSLIEQELMQQFREHEAVKAQLEHSEASVLSGRLPPTLAAQELLQAFGLSVDTSSNPN